MIGLRLSCAFIPSEEQRHPQEIMRDLGIEYDASLPDMAAESWKFYGVDPATVPKDLPSYLTIIADDPTVAINERANRIDRDIAHRQMVQKLFFGGDNGK